jgi:CRP-like cAMP-binding protein
VSIKQFISQVSLFALMDEDERAALAEKLDGRCLHEGEKLFSQGDKGDSLMLIRSGRVQIYVENADKTKIILGELQPGEVVGEVSLFDPGPRTATAIAMEHTDVLTLDHEDLWQVLQHRPSIALDMLAVIGKRLRSTDELLRRQVTRNVNVRDRETLSVGQRAADVATRVAGSWPFVIGVGAVMLTWLAANLHFARQFSGEYPLLLVTLAFAALAALQTSVIIMAQRRDEKHNRLRGDLEYDVNLKTELELAQMNHKIEQIYEAMRAGGKMADAPHSTGKGAAV